MKYIIIGNHSCNKHKVLDELEKLGVKVGREFTTSPTKILDFDKNGDQLTQLEVEDLFTNQSYVTICNINTGRGDFYRGVTQQTYDDTDITAMTPEMVNNIYLSRAKGDVCLIWIDDTKQVRRRRHIDERRKYNFEELEESSSFHVHSITTLLKRVCGDNWIYFSNENEDRIVAIIYSLIKHPDLLDIYIKYFK